MLSDTLSYDGKQMANYGMGWFNEAGSDPRAWISGYGGITFFSGGAPRMRIYSSGDVGIVGSASCQTLSLTSSNRFKQNVQPLAGALNTISGLQGVSYTWDDKHGGRKDIGFIAEDVAKVIPELVTMEDNGVDAKGMDYSHLTALTVEAIKEQQTQIATLKAENADLKARLARVERLLTPKTNTKPGK